MTLIITLILVGILLIVVEVLLIPGFAFAGIIGLGAMGASCYFAYTEFGTTTGTVILAINLILLVGFTILILRAKTWKKISLNTNIDSRADKAPEDKGIIVGQRGKTITRLNPMGKARIGDVTVEVTAREFLIDPEREIEVALIEDNKIYVSEVK